MKTKNCFYSAAVKKHCYDHADDLAETKKSFWNHVLNCYTEARFKSSFRVTRGTFMCILDILTPYLLRQRFSLGSRLALMKDSLFFFIEWEELIKFPLLQNYLDWVTLQYVI